MIKREIFSKRSFLIGGIEIGEIIPLPVWIIPFPVLEIHFEFLGRNGEDVVKEVFWSEAYKWEK